MEDLRDIVIIVFGIGGLIVALALAVMAFLLFRKLSSILDLARSTMNTVDAFNQGVLKPLVGASSILSVLGRVASWLAGSKEEKGHGDAR